MKILLTGAAGFIGGTLTRRLLERGHEPLILTRGVSQVLHDPSGKVFIPWDGQNVGEWWKFINSAEAVINLAGENIAARPWTDAQKKKILSSRIDATNAIVEAIQKIPKKPRLLINASAIGYYGDVPEGDVAEDHPHGKGFLAELCAVWEAAALQAGKFGPRVVIARFGLVLEKEGGMLGRMVPPFRYFMGGPLGSGKQWLSWVHREDLIGALIFLLEKENASGPFNLTAPEPLRMTEFCRALGRTLKRPSGLRVPSGILKIMLGEMSQALITGQRALPKRLLDLGFQFKYPLLEQALADIFKK